MAKYSLFIVLLTVVQYAHAAPVKPATEKTLQSLSGNIGELHLVEAQVPAHNFAWVAWTEKSDTSRRLTLALVDRTKKLIKWSKEWPEAYGPTLNVLHTSSEDQNPPLAFTFQNGAIAETLVVIGLVRNQTPEIFASVDSGKISFHNESGGYFHLTESIDSEPKNSCASWDAGNRRLKPIPCPKSKFEN